MSGIRVALVDDQALFRAGVRMLVESQPDLEVAGEAADGEAAVVLAARERPDVVLMDVRMPNVNGVEATRELLNDPSPPKVLLLTTFDIEDDAVEALRAGASGFLLKDVHPMELAQAIRVVARGEALLSSKVTRRLLDAFAASTPPVPPVRARVLATLTETEIRVLVLIGEGRSNDEIATELFVSDSTVRTHVRHILEKLELRDRVHAVVLAYDAGLVQPNYR
jgi:DNA-binding NarL/FixJ family response regulator